MEKPKQELTEPLYWEMVLISDTAMAAMDHRAGEESAKVEEGTLIDIAHEQAVRDYAFFEKMVKGAITLLKWTGNPAAGDAIDLGSGTGVGAVILSKFDRIKKVYALELSVEFVKQIMPMVFERFDAQVDKIQRVVGDFNHVDLLDGSLDMVLEIGAFHHSEDLDITLKECYRVLKKGGTLIAVDRAWPDRYTREELEAKLDVELNDNLKRKYNIPVGESFTRRDFGEHEYTLKEWHEFFSRNGFDCASLVERHPPILNRIFLRIPTFKFSIWFSALMYRMGSRRLWIYGFSKRRVLFVCVKR